MWIMHPIADCNTGFHQHWRYVWTCKGLCGQFYNNIHTSQGYVKPIYLLTEHLVICLHLWPWCGTCRRPLHIEIWNQMLLPLICPDGSHNHLIHSWEPGPNYCCGCIKGNHYISLVYKTGWKKKQFSKGPENWVVGAIMQGGEFWCNVLLKLV